MAQAHRLDDNEAPPNRQRIISLPALPVASLLVASLLLSCSAEDLFTQGRVHEPCSGNYPTCHTAFTAGCYLDSDGYAESQFPGARRVLVATDGVDQTIRVRLFFRQDTMIFPGTEILVQAWEPDCGDVERDHRLGIDVFEEAGDDGVITFDLPAESPGDHLVEIFSDCSADCLLAVDRH